MITNCTVIGEKPIGDKKEITFEYYIDSCTGLINVIDKPKLYKNIELIAKNFEIHLACPLDLMFTYNDLRSTGTLYLGKWNDGIVIND